MLNWIFAAVISGLFTQVPEFSSHLLEETHSSKLAGKKIGYYTGSFDPLHNGHKRLVEEILQEGLVDYVIVSPVPGGDKYKNRSNFELRKEMLRAVFKKEPRVLLTDLFPSQMQDRLSPYFGKFEVIGIVGSDFVLGHLSDPDKIHKDKVSQVFMRGLKILEKHAENTTGAIMALPATSFIVSLRNEDDLTSLNGMFEDRAIRAFVRLEYPYSHLSSTQVREANQLDRPISDMVDPKVLEIIQREGLYK